MGQTVMYGSAKTHMAVLSAPASEGDTQITLKEEPAGWAVGDDIVIAGTQTGNPESDERRSILSIRGSTVELDQPLELDHKGIKEDLDVHVANMTRSIEIRSASTELDKRGHIMFMHNLSVDVRHIAFSN